MAETAGICNSIYMADRMGVKSNAAEYDNSIRDIIGNKSDDAGEVCRVRAWDYHDPENYDIEVGVNGIAVAVPKPNPAYMGKIQPMPKISVRYVRYRAAGIKGNAYKRLRHETRDIDRHYKHKRLMKAKQAIFVHRTGWDRRMV